MNSDPAERLLMKYGRTNKTVRRPRKKAPWDVKIVAGLDIFNAVGALLFAEAFLARKASIADFPGWVPLILFGTVQVTSDFWFGILSVVYVCLNGITAYGLLKRWRLGWWGQLLLTLDGITICIGNARYTPIRSYFWIVVNVLLLFWLIYRMKMYRPFGRFSGWPRRKSNDLE